MSDHDIVSRLSAIDLFEGLSPRVLKHIASEGEVRTFAAGTPVVEEGSSTSGWSSFSREGVCFYAILEGEGTVEVHGVPKATLTAGQYFGETSLIDGLPRTATVTAGPDGMTAFALSAFVFAPILEQNPSMAIQMLKVIVGRLRRAEAASAGE